MSKNYLRIASMIGLALNFGLLLLPPVASASLLNQADCSSRFGLFLRCTDIGPREFIISIINIILSVAGLLAVLFVIIGGFQYIFSGANEEWAESGKKTLKNAIIGVIIIVLSYVIVNVISRILQG